MVEVLPTVFSNYVELHTAELGVLLGLFVGLVYRERPTLAYALLFLGVLSALGNASHIGFMRYSDVATEIEAKPWYFLSALYLTTVANLLVLEYGASLRRRFPTLAGGEANDVVPTDDGS